MPVQADNLFLFVSTIGLQPVEEVIKELVFWNDKFKLVKRI